MRHSAKPAPAAASSSSQAIISPIVDALCVGGLSLVLLLPLLLSGRADLVLVGVGMQAWVPAAAPVLSRREWRRNRG